MQIVTCTCEQCGPVRTNSTKPSYSLGRVLDTYTVTQNAPLAQLGEDRVVELHQLSP